MGISYVFISHSWSHSEHYEAIADWLFEPPVTFNGSPVYFYDKSVPKNHPIHSAGSTEELREEIFLKILQCHVIVVPTGMYTQCSKWIKEELASAQACRKPILAVKLKAQKRRASRVEEVASEVVRWSGQSVVDSVWKMSVRGY